MESCSCRLRNARMECGFESNLNQLLAAERQLYHCAENCQWSSASMIDRGPEPFNHASAPVSPRRYASQNAVDSARITR